MTGRVLLGWIVVLLMGLGGAGRAAAQVERHAILIGSNRGFTDEVELRFAERDADKVAGVLRLLGGFPDENVTVLRAPTPATLRRAIHAINSRLRALPGEALLFVYYSGHADAEGLHLGGARFDHDELTALVAASPATIRLMVLDACRSGSVTRSKGGRAIAAFDITTGESLGGEGAIFLSSSASDEDSQESDELQSSFFTHYLVSGLIGAADTDRDGKVVVDEAYRYAYENTLRASSRTRAGTQHPTFRYDVRGRGRIPLSWPAASVPDHGRVSVPRGRTYLFFERNAEGGVVAEVGERDVQRTITLRAGRYFVRGRGDDHLLEGYLEVVPGRDTGLEEARLERIAYARLVRKGGGQRAAHAFTTGGNVRSGLASPTDICVGGAAGYRMDRSTLSLHARLAACQDTHAHVMVETTERELGIDVSGLHVWDRGPVSLEIGLGLGTSWLHQEFATRGVASRRDLLAPSFGVDAGLAYELGARWYMSLNVRARTYYLRRTSDGAGDAPLSTVFTRGGAVSFGWRY